MPPIPFTGAGFSLQTVEYKPYYVIELKFTQDPLRANPLAPNDCTNPANYSLHGPHAATVTVVNTTADPQILRLTVNVPLEVGDWTVVVANNVLSDTGAAFVAPKSLTFSSTTTVTPVSELDPYRDDGSLDILRKHMSGAFKGPGWDALLVGIAAGDEICRSNIFNVFDQLFISSANGKYLDRKASDQGISRPELVGMDDDAFRRYTIRSTNSKLTLQSVWEILEVFYGTESVVGWCKSNLFEPFALEDGDTLSFMVDEEIEVPVTFLTSDFDSIAAAKAEEVAAVITRTCNSIGAPAYAVSYLDPDTDTWRVKLYSQSLGMRSSIRVIGGRANNELEFPTRIDVVAAAGVNWTITNIDQDTIQFSTIDTDVTITDARAGDYVNIYMVTAAPFEGTFEILSVSTAYVGADILRSFTIDPGNQTLADGVYNQADIDELVFFRPTNNDIYLSSNRTIQAAQHARSQFDITVPATTEIVMRTEGQAAYGQIGPELAATASGAHDTVTFTCNNTLSAGDWVLIDGVECATDISGVSGAVDPVGGAGQIGTSPIEQWQTTTHAEDQALGNCFAGIVDGNTLQVMFGTNGAGVGPANGIEETVSPTGGLTLVAAANPGTLTSPAGCVFSLESSVQAGKPVVMGGLDGLGVASTEIYINKVIAVATLSYPHTYHSAVAFDDGVVVVGPGADDLGVIQTSIDHITVDEIDPVNLSVVSTPGATLEARRSYAMKALADGRILFSGGVNLDTLSTCELYDPVTSIATATGQMTFARSFHDLVRLANGNMLAIGGVGFKKSIPAAWGYVEYPELYDVATGKWSVINTKINLAAPASVLNWTRAVLMDDGNVLVVGEMGAKILDTTTWKLHAIPGWVSANGVYGFSVLKVEADQAGGLARYCVTGMADHVAGETSYTLWLVDAEELSNGIANVNGLHRVASANPASFTVVYEDAGYLNPATAITVTPVAAIEGEISGPYLVDDSGVSVSEYASTTVDAIWSGTKKSIVEVASGVDFSDAGGWLVFAFGQSNQVGPVAYTGKQSVNELQVDDAFVFTSDLPVGSTVTLLTQRGPWVPESPLVGLMYLTASVAGRLECANALLNNLAAGIDLTVRVSYPSDIGLGNAGHPVDGASKLSDAVYVWGTDDPDSEIAAARILLNE